MGNQDRAQINLGFQQLNQSTLHSIQQLDLKFSENHLETNRIMEEVTSVIQDSIKMQSDKLSMIMRPKSVEKPKQFHIDTQLEQFKNFGI